MRLLRTPLLVAALLAAASGAHAQPAPIRYFASADEEMNAAMAHARTTIPALLARLAEPPATQEHLAVKVRLQDGDNIEHVWMHDVRFEDGLLHGVLSNQPARIRGFSRGDAYRVKPEEISDWYAMDDGRLCAGYTVRVHRARVDFRERRAMDRGLGLTREPDDSC